MARSKENTHSEPARLEQVIEIVGMSFTDLEMTFDDLMYSGAMLTKDNVFRVGLMQALHEVAITLQTELMDLIDFLEESIDKDPDEDMRAIARAAVLRQELMDFLSKVTLFVGDIPETMGDMVGDWRMDLNSHNRPQ
ncbi:hypothetical protein KC921_02580 [Candidatus Woesebacteria bacterium]|nr:hypothetical protein [Candidatus Woesebacteria bacterium]